MIDNPNHGNLAGLKEHGMNEKEKSACMAGFGFGFVMGAIVLGVIGAMITWDYHCSIRSLRDDAVRYRADAVKYGYAEWVTCKDGNPGFQWKVPVEEVKK